jgi:hypothetical protein
MKQWALGLMSNDEKRSILDQHKTLYNGYKTMQPKVSNEQPLYTQDFANDKGGVTVNNKGNVKAYTNIGINEQVEKESMCSECGGMMYEGECSECGYNGGEMGEEMQQVKDLENVEDLNLSDKFDYTEEEIDEISVDDLKKGKKYKFKHPAFSDEIEFEDEIDSDLDKIYKFRGKDTHAMPKKGVESFVDYLDEDDALDADALQNVTGQDVPHDADDMAPDGMDDDSDNDRGMMADGEMEEQVGGGTAPYQNFDSIKPAYNFVSGGPVKEDEFETMESAWADDKGDMEDFEDDEEVYPIFTKDEFVGMGKKLGDMELDEPESSEWEEIIPDSDEDDLSHLDEEIRESVTKQKNRIMEMMNRMKGYN